MATLKRKSKGPERRGLVTALVLMSTIIFAGVYVIQRMGRTEIPDRLPSRVDIPGLPSMPSVLSGKKEDPKPKEPELNYEDRTTMNHQKSGAIVGKPVILSGNTIQIDQYVFHLWGVSTRPEYTLCQANKNNFPCGTNAEEALRLYINDRLVACYVRGTDPNGNYLGQCFKGQIDLNGLVVENGLGYAKRSETTNYHFKEGMGRSRNVGVWARR